MAKVKRIFVILFVFFFLCFFLNILSSYQNYNQYLELQKITDISWEKLDKTTLQNLANGVFPVAGNQYFISANWHAPREGGRIHLGIDIFAPEGTEVRAVMSGKVVKSGWLSLGGNRVLIKDQNGLYHYYAHLKGIRPEIKPGRKVKRGEVIGYVGHTGNADFTPDHLHYGLYAPGMRAVNPYNLLKYWEKNTVTLTTKP
ncbi:M23 family metallopeptidase [Carboxydothermus hydrogenoformans]|uniref:Peptidase, M23/M37 family n=1 Tax=Carboxydothermus hydrogenoformans (strain ATCC BAA-161 / DSM 6008 / Z-2901) TaxID=246194 RepID=Q3ADS2_CARHZ|nr:M23 family metallopeptidase [Carboxydothermus hydrogenoformans]ABB15671.1 peptidase, M23/M37 family [Carboxydothermus hydrogenoformans Z-2901]